MSLVVERVQYGVGQGAFHTQSITIDGNCYWAPRSNVPPDGLRFDFVYDCGSKKSEIPDALSQSIKHYRPKRTLANPDAAESVDAVFISHFHDDHISGITELCKAKTVERIFAPFHTEEDVLAVILRSAEWISASSFSDEQAALFLTELGKLYRRERLFGRPTIYVLPPEMETEFAPGGALLDPPLPAFPPGIRVAGSVNQTASFTDNDALSIGSVRPGRGSRCAWEIKTWHFRQNHATPSKAWQGAINDLNTALNGILGQRAVIDGPTAKALLNQAAGIQIRLGAALKEEGVTDPGNHNLVSLCVYSGPPIDSFRASATSINRMNGPSVGNHQTDFHLDFSLQSPKFGRLRGKCHAAEDDSNRTGWLGTGDALLGDDTVWKEFSNRFDWWERTAHVATVQIPHHGSAGSYYNPKLIPSPDTLAVISAGAYSNYKHPTLAVLSDILQRGNPVVHIHEFVRPGLIEIVKVDY